jgi:hypothetical protein
MWLRPEDAGHRQTIWNNAKWADLNSRVFFLPQNPDLKFSRRPSPSLLHSIMAPQPNFDCPKCNLKCRSHSGISRHMNAMHPHFIPADESTQFKRFSHPYLSGT